jgi:signal transduction histidine kinase
MFESPSLEAPHLFTEGYSKMKTFFKSIMIVLAALAFTGGAWAADKGTADEAVAMVKKAVAFLKANGKEKAFAEFSNQKGQFVDRDLYVMVYDMEGNNKAHGSNPKLIGKNLLEIKDADGKFIVKGLIEVAQKGKGWFDYKWPNAVTKAVEPKSTYVEKADDVLIGVGIYK